MPWNGEETCSMPYNENLSSQIVDYKCAKCGKLGHDSSSCIGKKKTFEDVLVTNYDEFYHKNEPLWDVNFLLQLLVNVVV